MPREAKNKPDGAGIACPYCGKNRHGVVHTKPKPNGTIARRSKVKKLARLNHGGISHECSARAAEYDPHGRDTEEYLSRHGGHSLWS